MISLIALFDHEEIGSQSAQGAGSPVMAEAVKRITSAFSDVVNVEAHSSAVRKSFVLSVDQAHAVHPNYASKHEKNHGPKMNAGVVIKTNQNQRCKSSFVTLLLLCGTLLLIMLLFYSPLSFYLVRRYQRSDWLYCKGDRAKIKYPDARICCQI